MAVINRSILVPYMDAYKKYLDSQEQGRSGRALCNAQEDYKREVAVKAAELLNRESWSEADIGKGTIGEASIKAVQKNDNLIGRFQVSLFAEKVREDFAFSERVLYNLYHEHEERECFDQFCGLFGKKYDLLAYLYFVLDPDRYLPVRSSIFDDVFSKLEIDFRTSGLCSWDNYQEYLATIAMVRAAMTDHYQSDEIDLLDAHSFLWTVREWSDPDLDHEPSDKKTPETDKAVDVGAIVYHKDYGEGRISKLTEEKVYVEFGREQRIFKLSAAFEKEYLNLI